MSNIQNLTDLVQVSGTDEFQKFFDVSNLSFDQINKIKDALIALEIVVGNLPDLDTSSKESIVEAINSVRSEFSNLQAQIGDTNQLPAHLAGNLTQAVIALNDLLGDLNLLETVQKDSIVNAINSDATELNRGTVKIASQTLVDDGIDDSVVITPKKLRELSSGSQTALALGALVASASVPQANETTEGVTRTGTQQEVDDGLDDFVYITPKKLNGLTASSTVANSIRALIPTSSELTFGTIKLASQQETIDGINDTKAVTPLTLKARLTSYDASQIPFSPFQSIIATNVQTAIEQTETRISNLEFTDLNDTPTTFSGQALKFLKVNQNGTGVTFDNISFLDLSDTGTTFSGNANKLLKVNSIESSIEFAAPEDFLELKDLSDIPNSYQNLGGKVLTVKADETGVEFQDIVFPDLEVILSSYARDLSVSGGLLYAFISVGTVNIPQNFVGSHARLKKTPASTLVLDIKLNSISVGTLTFPAGSSVGSFASSSAITLNNTDQLEVFNSLTPDSNASDLYFSIKGSR